MAEQEEGPRRGAQNDRTQGRGIRFEVVEARTEKDLDFDPEAFSKAGNATCPFCGTVADSLYVKAEGCSGRLTTQLMAAIATSADRNEKNYIGADS